MRRRGPRKTAGAFPRCLDLARGARITDIAGHEYVDFCLGDTGAMAGHSPVPVAEAVARRYAEPGGATAMLPSEDAEWAGAERTRRFGLARWSFSLTATDANRWARGIPLTPFHNRALMFPDTTEQDVDAHTEIFAAALAAPHG